MLPLPLSPLPLLLLIVLTEKVWTSWELRSMYDFKALAALWKKGGWAA